MTKDDQYLINEVQAYITSLENIKKTLNHSNLSEARHAADHTLRLARQLLAELHAK